MDKAQEKYKTAKAFRVAITAKLKTIARETGEPYLDLYRGVAIDRFLARLDWNKWRAKGGYVLQRRLPKARRTKDIDLSTGDAAFLLGTIEEKKAALLDYFQNMARIDAGDYFEFQVTEDSELDGFGQGGLRCQVRALLDGESFSTFQVDAVIQDQPVFSAEEIQGDAFLSFAGIEPLTLLVPIKEEVLAEKIHAYTTPRENENTRVKDLLDLALLVEDGLEQDKAQKAIVKVFAVRNTHKVVTDLPKPPNSWLPIFETLTSETGIELTLDEAFSMVQGFYKTLSLQ